MNQIPYRPPYYGQQNPTQVQQVPMYSQQQAVQPIPRTGAYPPFSYQEPQEQEGGKSWKYIIWGLVLTVIATAAFVFFRKRPLPFNLNKSTLSGKKQYVDGSILEAKEEEIASLKRIIATQKESLNGHTVEREEDYSGVSMGHEKFRDSFNLPGIKLVSEQSLDTFIDWLVEERGFTFNKEGEYANNDIPCKVTLEKQGIWIKIADFNPIFRAMTEITALTFREQFDELIQDNSKDE